MSKTAPEDWRISLFERDDADLVASFDEAEPIAFSREWAQHFLLKKKDREKA